MPCARQAHTAYLRARVGLTLVAVDFQEEIKRLRTTMDSVREVTDLDTLTAQIARLDRKSVV